MSKDHLLYTIKDEQRLSPMLCRICATERTDGCLNNLLTSIHNGLYYADMLQECLQRTVIKDHGFPLSICLDCTSTLIVAHNFHLKCNDSDKKFREMLGYDMDGDCLEQKIGVNESEERPSCFIDCTAVDMLNIINDETKQRGRFVTELEHTKPLASRYECYQCKATFERILQLRQHISNCRQTSDNMWQCSECHKQFSERKNLMKHLYKHTKACCEHCHKTFATLRHLQHHCQEMHKDLLVYYQCERCPRKFVLSSQLNIHMHNHSNKQRYDCNICNEIFASEMKLKAHIRSVHTTYLCSECGKTFKNNSLLTSHQKVHNSEKPFECPKCPSRFKWKVALTYHMTIHQQERKHVCETCGMSFTTRSAMKGHMRIHTGERPFACDKCTKRFYRNTHLKRHFLSHTGEKPYKCKYCDKGFRQCAQLNKHLRLHVGENTYQCDLCPNKFKFKADMKKHFHEHYENKDVADLTITSET